jgi:lambda repressor-like predicted transcriptional regulator
MGGRTMKVLRCRLIEILGKKNMTVKELTRRSGITYPTLAGYIVNRRCPSYLNAIVIAECLGCDVKELFEVIEK